MRPPAPTVAATAVPLATLSRFPLQWTRLLPRPHVAVSVTPGKARMLAHQAEWSLLSGRDGILDRSRNGQVRRSSRVARRQRDGGHEQQESTPQRLSSARGLHGWPARWSLVHLTASGGTAAGSSHSSERVVSGGASGGVLQSCALVHSMRGVPPHGPTTLLCCAQLRLAPYLVQRSTAQCSGTRAGDGERPQSGQNRLADRPIGSTAITITHDKYNKMNRKSILQTHMVGGALSPQGGREASFLMAARSAKKISRCKNSTAVDNYPRAIQRAWSKTKIKIGKPAISRRSFFHFWRPSSGPLPSRTAASAPARQEACESEEFAFGLWWPLRGGVGVFWLQWPPEGSPALAAGNARLCAEIRRRRQRTQQPACA